MKLSEIADKLGEQLDYIVLHMEILDNADRDVSDMEWDFIKKQLIDHNAIGFSNRTVEYKSSKESDILKPSPFDVLECLDLRIRNLVVRDFSALPKRVNGEIYINKSILDIPKFIDYLDELPSAAPEIYMIFCHLSIDEVYEVLETKYKFTITFNLHGKRYRLFTYPGNGKISIICLDDIDANFNFDSVFELQEWFVDHNVTTLD